MLTTIGEQLSPCSVAEWGIAVRCFYPATNTEDQKEGGEQPFTLSPLPHSCMLEVTPPLRWTFFWRSPAGSVTHLQCTYTLCTVNRQLASVPITKEAVGSCTTRDMLNGHSVFPPLCSKWHRREATTDSWNSKCGGEAFGLGERVAHAKKQVSITQNV